MSTCLLLVSALDRLQIFIMVELSFISHFLTLVIGFSSSLKFGFRISYPKLLNYCLIELTFSFGITVYILMEVPYCRSSSINLFFILFTLSRIVIFKQVQLLLKLCLKILGLIQVKLSSRVNFFSYSSGSIIKLYLFMHFLLFHSQLL